MDRKSKQIYRLREKGNESILSGLEVSPRSLPRTLNLAVQSAQSDAAGVLRLVKGEGGRPVNTTERPTSGFWENSCFISLRPS
jgi:hypothetical protein